MAARRSGDEYWALLEELKLHVGELVPTEENLHAAAVGLASELWRNTEAVEDIAHASGPWTDEDMLRNNARATEVCRQALRECRDTADSSREGILSRMQRELLELLPSDEARDALDDETSNSPVLYAETMRRLGFGFVLARLTHTINYPNRWWGAPNWPALVDKYCAMEPAPPEPDTFRQRMLETPWELSDEQALFVTEHRYGL